MCRFACLPEEAADAGQRTFEHVLAMAAGLLYRGRI